MPENIGYTLYIDEAGDEGIGRVRPLQPDGASEFFVLAGLMVRSTRLGEVRLALSRVKNVAGVPADKELHFRDLGDTAQDAAISELAKFKAG
ncbi:MAG TPA: DUF3800 domain-containing protein, partial [Devosia sp.]